MAGVELYAPRKARHRRTWTVAALLLAVVFIALGQVLGVLPAMATGFIGQDGAANRWPQLAYLLYVAFAAGAVLTLLWAALFERRGPGTVGLNDQGLRRFGRGFAIGLAFLLAVVGIIHALDGYTVEAGGVFDAGAVGVALVPILVLLGGFIVQGSTEEIVFRGWLMQVIASRHGLWLAVILNSALFALVHGGNIAPSRELYLGLVNIVLFGLFISLYAAREGSVWGVCGWHAAWNWLLGLGFGLEVSGQVVETRPLVVDLATNDGTAWWITGAAFGPEASVVTTGVLLIGLLVLVVRGHTRGHPVEA